MSFVGAKATLTWGLFAIIVIHEAIAYPRLGGIGNDGDSVVDSNLLISRDTPSYSYLADPPASIDTFTIPSPSDTSSQTNVAVRAAVNSDAGPTSNKVYDKDLHLRSGSRNVTGVNGYALYASPINSTQLLALLLATHNNLNTYRGRNDVTNFYQLNYTTWSFEVVVANGTIHYTTISSIVKRFLRLIPHKQVIGNITWTRVACLYNGDKPIANVAIVPLPTDPETVVVDFDKTGFVPATPTPVQVLTISPTGVINSTEVISPDALDIYRNSQVEPHPKRQTSSLEREVILKVINTGLYVTLHIFRDPNGEGRRTLAVFFTVVIFLSLSQFALGLLAELVLGSGSDGAAKVYGIDSGSWHLGQMSARFVMKTTARDPHGNLIAFDPKTWEAIANAILEPLKRVGKGQEVYAVAGEVKGPDPNRTAEAVTLAEWQLTAEPTPVNRDEL